MRQDRGMAEAHWALARIDLLRGNHVKGWSRSRWGFEAGTRDWAPPPLPEYAGRADPRSTVVVWADCGLTDQLMFAQLLPRLAARVRRVVVQAEPGLVPLLGRSFPDIVTMAPVAPLALRRQVPEATDQLPFADLARILSPLIEGLNGGRRLPAARSAEAARAAPALPPGGRRTAGRALLARAG